MLKVAPLLYGQCQLEPVRRQGLLSRGLCREHQQQQTAADIITTILTALPNFVQLYDQSQSMQVKIIYNAAAAVLLFVCYCRPRYRTQKKQLTE